MYTTNYIGTYSPVDSRTATLDATSGWSSGYWPSDPEARQPGSRMYVYVLGTYQGTLLGGQILMLPTVSGPPAVSACISGDIKAHIAVIKGCKRQDMIIDGHFVQIIRLYSQVYT